MQNHDYTATGAALEQHAAFEESAAFDDYVLEHAGDDRDPRFDNIDLEAIPRDLWRQALAPLHRQQRTWLASQLRDKRLRAEAMELAIELDFAEDDRKNARLEARHRARRTGAPLPTPSGDHPAGRGTVQVNMRLRRDDHARLAEAAATVGLKPTTLARALVLNGAAQILRDHATG
jgi:hypothetical protein